MFESFCFLHCDWQVILPTHQQNIFLEFRYKNNEKLKKANFFIPKSINCFEHKVKSKYAIDVLLNITNYMLEILKRINVQIQCMFTLSKNKILSKYKIENSLTSLILVTK